MQRWKQAQASGFVLSAVSPHPTAAAMDEALSLEGEGRVVYLLYLESKDERVSAHKKINPSASLPSLPCFDYPIHKSGGWVFDLPETAGECELELDASQKKGPKKETLMACITDYSVDKHGALTVSDAALTAAIACLRAKLPV